VLGQGVSLLGDYLAFFLALPVFVRDRTGSAGSLGALAAAETVAVLVFGFLAGVLIDRVRIRRAVVLADVARAAAFGLLSLAVVLGVDETWMAFAVAFVIGSMGTVFDSGLQSYMPALLPDDQLGPTNGAIEVARNLAMTIGFLAGGAVLAWGGGIAGAFAFDALTYLVSVAALLGVREIRERRRAAPEPVLEAIRAGLTFLMANRPIRWATGAAVVTNLAFAPLAAVLTLFAERELGILDEQILGLFFALFSVIAAGGGLTASRLMRAVGIGRALVVGTALFGLGAIGAGISTGWWAALPFGVATGGVAINQAAFVTLRQHLTPDDLLGRVVSASRTIAFAGIPVGAAVGGLIGDAVGLRPLYVGGGALIVLVAAALTTGPLWRSPASQAPADTA
jgi:MFS family permease